MNESGERRLCFAGRKLEENCHDVENNDSIAETLEKTRVAVDFVLGKQDRCRPRSLKCFSGPPFSSGQVCNIM